MSVNDSPPPPSLAHLGQRRKIWLIEKREQQLTLMIFFCLRQCYRMIYPLGERYLPRKEVAKKGAYVRNFANGL